jgi:hypothetical protein
MIRLCLRVVLECREYSGADSVVTFRGARAGVPSARPGYRAFCIGLTLAGLAWMGVGFSGFGESMWIGVGLLTSLAGAFLLAISFNVGSRAGQIKNLRNARLVIGPHGMAMVQGDVQGELRWPELLEVRVQAKPSGFHWLATPVPFPRVLLGVKGASIAMADIYDRPLFAIYNRILASSDRSTPRDLE